MFLKRLTVSAAALMAAAACTPALAERASTVIASPRQSFDFDQDWVMKTGDDPAASTTGFDDKAWTAVTLPHAFNETEAFARDIHKLSTGITWYRKHFRLPADFRPGHAFLEFQGVRQAAEVWVNGVEIGLSENGVMAFGFDITNALKPGDNVVAVRVDNDWKYKERTTGSAFQWSDMNFYANYGGINKPVRLHLTGDLYQTLPLYSNLGTTGAYIWADGFDVPAGAATIHAETQTRNDGTAARDVAYTVEVRDLDGKTVASFDGGTATIQSGETKTLVAERRLSGLHFWSWGYGYLYTVTTVLKDKAGHVIDAVDTRTGFRKTEFADGMFKLNDRVLQLKGYAQRTTDEWPAVGISVPPWITDFSDGLVTGSNGNLVRWMHVTPSKQQIESSDRLGLITNMPAGDSEGDPSGRRWTQRVELMRDAIIYNRNDPSIVFYESGNKGISPAHMADMKAVRDQYDPHGGRAIGSREMLGADSVAEYGGEMLYINKSATKPLWAHEYSRDEAARAYQDDFTPPFHKDAPDYNRNVESMAVEDVRRWDDYYRERPGSGTRVSAGGVKIGFTDSNSHFRGDNNYRRSGVIDAVRLPKDPWYVHQVMWDGWVNSEVPRTHIIGHWTYAPGTTKTIYVASNGDHVELFVNGKSLGQGQRSDGFLFTFPNVAFTPGELKAVATYDDGRTSQDVATTAGAPASIRLTPHYGPRGLMADGADLMLVDVEVVDGKGQRVPTAFNPVTFKLKGAAQWKGGIAQTEAPADPAKKDAANGVLATTLPVELGVNRVLIRSTNTAGKVHLEASADGLKGATLDTVSKPVAAKDGLSSVFAEDYQPSDLSRGPTPSTPSFTQWRRAVDIASITAGSNADAAAKSHDDNETTAWTSDGKPETAWIEYTFTHPDTPEALSLKLTGWRLRAYPIRVTVDGQVVFEGTTPKSLGYVDLDLKPVTGKSLRISLMGNTEDRDAFGKIVELKDNKEAQSVGADKVPAGMTLSIVEADILAKAQTTK
ncbi:glycoside hydrolase family 2 protein [Asticcacaulis solisilvae]|uniref:glycoside hydrolase family 2 protein n=1 Tax=Asticcacaulis solisilvae TaxID=1217274 RepID=UPI003FD714F8